MTSVTTRSKQSNTETLSLARLDIKSFHSHMYLLKNKEKKKTGKIRTLPNTHEVSSEQKKP